MRFLLGVCLIACPLSGQFSNLTTDDAGDRVWFSSALRLSGSQEVLFTKIFVADSVGNVQLVAEAASGDPYSNLTNPEVSGDGKVLAYSATYNCPPQETCKIADYATSMVNGLRLPGAFHLSRNGRYVAREGYFYYGPTGQFEIIDLTTGEKRDIAVENFQQITTSGRQVTSVGSVLAYSDTLWVFGLDGSAQPVPTANFTIPSPTPFFSFAGRAAVDDAGDKIAYQSTNGCFLVLTSPSAAAQATTLVSSSGLPCTMQLQSLSADGATVLFISSDNFDGSNTAGLPQCWVVDTASKQMTAVGHDSAGIAEATMSGDGTVVWATTLAGRLTRMLRSTGATQEIIPQTVAIDQDPLFPLVAAAGALVHLTGRGLAAQSATSSAPLATTLAGIQLLADGQPLPLLSLSPTDIVFQVPWEMQGAHTLTLPATQSPFEEVLARNLQVQPTQPSFWYTATGSPVIAHQDFHGLVSSGDPAHPDEILHLYLTGMGPVTPPVATGEAASTSSLSTVPGPVYVSWAGELPINFPMNAQVLFAGLAPGTVGLEQVDIQVPHEAPAQLGVSIQVVGSGTSIMFPVAPGF